MSTLGRYDQKFIVDQILTNLRSQLKGIPTHLRGTWPCEANARADAINDALAGHYRRLIRAVGSGLLEQLAAAEVSEPSVGPETFADIHRAETIAYVLGLVRELHRSEAARVALYARLPHAAALGHIARDRAARLEQLVRAIEAGLYDQLGASETGGLANWERELLALPDAEPMTAEQVALDNLRIRNEHELNVAEDADLARQGAEMDQAVESTGHLPGWADVDQAAPEADSPPSPLKQAHTVLGAVMDSMPADFRAHAWEIAALASEPPCIGIQQGGNQGDAEARRAIRSIAGLLALSYEEVPKPGYILIRAVGEIDGVRVEIWDHATAPEPVEYFDQAEADDVREIEHEMAVEAGDDSELDRQVAEDDARAERNAELEPVFHDSASCWECLGACTRCGDLNHKANDCEAES